MPNFFSIVRRRLFYSNEAAFNPIKESRRFVHLCYSYMLYLFDFYRLIHCPIISELRLHTAFAALEQLYTKYSQAIQQFHAMVVNSYFCLYLYSINNNLLSSCFLFFVVFFLFFLFCFFVCFFCTQYSRAIQQGYAWR